MIQADGNDDFDGGPIQEGSFSEITVAWMTGKLTAGEYEQLAAARI